MNSLRASCRCVTPLLTARNRRNLSKCLRSTMPAKPFLIGGSTDLWVGEPIRGLNMGNRLRFWNREILDQPWRNGPTAELDPPRPFNENHGAWSVQDCLRPPPRMARQRWASPCRKGKMRVGGQPHPYAAPQSLRSQAWFSTPATTPTVSKAALWTIGVSACLNSKSHSPACPEKNSAYAAPYLRGDYPGAAALASVCGCL